MIHLGSFEPYFVLLLLTFVFATMASEKLRVDVTALLGVGALLVTGVLPTGEVLKVFSNEAPITVAAMFILSAALERTGVVETCGRLVQRYASKTPLTALLAVTVGSAAVSAFINNTPVVVILTPVVIALAGSLKMSPSKFLIPLSYATVMGGTCSLIGTSTNIVANGAAVQGGLAPFSLFEITPVGAAITGVGILYMMVFAFRLLPDRETFSTSALAQHRRQFLTEVLVPLGSPLVDRRLDDPVFVRKLGARIIDVIRNRMSLHDRDDIVLQAGDRLVLRTNVGDIIGLREATDGLLETKGQHAIEPIGSQNTTVMEGIVGPQSRFVGHRLADLNLRRLYGVYILAVHRQNENLRSNFDRVRLAFGDTLLLEGPPEGLRQLFEQGALVSLSEPAEKSLRRDKAWLAGLAILLVIILATFEVMPISGLAMLAVLAVIVGGAIDADEAYAAMRWPLLMLIFGSLALGKAMETSGAAQMVVDATMLVIKDLSPAVVLSIFYLLTVVLTEFLSNNATAILLTPIAIGLAHGLGVDARPFVAAVMFAASNAFATPVGYQTNTFVYNAGGYKFADFVRLGLPLDIVTWLTGSLLIPLVWPFHP
ncbi:MAG: SLC13 family permease [Geminicoccaceae bacterium]